MKFKTIILRISLVLLGLIICLYCLDRAHIQPFPSQLIQVEHVARPGVKSPDSNTRQLNQQLAVVEHKVNQLFFSETAVSTLKTIVLAAIVMLAIQPLVAFALTLSAPTMAEIPHNKKLTYRPSSRNRFSN